MINTTVKIYRLEEKNENSITTVYWKWNSEGFYKNTKFHYISKLVMNKLKKRYYVKKLSSDHDDRFDIPVDYLPTCGHDNIYHKCNCGGIKFVAIVDILRPLGQERIYDEEIEYYNGPTHQKKEEEVEEVEEVEERFCERKKKRPIKYKITISKQLYDDEVVDDYIAFMNHVALQKFKMEQDRGHYNECIEQFTEDCENK
jgi:hypothetical protein